MSNAKKKITKSPHVYTEDQNSFILDNVSMSRTDLAKKFNKAFGTRITAIAVGKRRQRLKSSEKKTPSSSKKNKESNGIETHGIAQLVDALRENNRLIAEVLRRL